MKPIKDNIIIEPIEYAKTESGLFIKATEMEQLTGLVIAVGDGTKKNPMFVKKGQQVQYMNNVGRPLEYEGKKYLLIREAHVIAIL